jgi:hypothetical protein
VRTSTHRRFRSVLVDEPTQLSQEGVVLVLGDLRERRKGLQDCLFEVVPALFQEPPRYIGTLTTDVLDCDG